MVLDANGSEFGDWSLKARVLIHWKVRGGIKVYVRHLPVHPIPIPLLNQVDVFSAFRVVRVER